MPINCDECPRNSERQELGREISWAGGWQEFYQRRGEWEMYDYWTERYNALRREYATRFQTLPC